MRSSQAGIGHYLAAADARKNLISRLGEVPGEEIMQAIPTN
jgi:hypothetical protein